MNIKKYEGKDEAELLTKALEELGVTEKDTLHYTETTRSGLLKKETYTLNIVTIEDILKYVKEFLNTTINNMGIEVSFETQIRDNQISIKMYSNNNKVLIGKNGQTLESLTIVAKQIVFNSIRHYPHIILDVENYKEKQVNHLERLAKNIAKEVATTKEEVALENMNSYERRIIHNILSDNKHVYTESVGEEPNRHVIIKPKEQ